MIPKVSIALPSFKLIIHTNQLTSYIVSILCSFPKFGKKRKLFWNTIYQNFKSYKISSNEKTRRFFVLPSDVYYESCKWCKFWTWTTSITHWGGRKKKSTLRLYWKFFIWTIFGFIYITKTEHIFKNWTRIQIINWNPIYSIFCCC